MPRSSRCRYIILAAVSVGCSETAPPEPEVATIQLSSADTAIRFRDQLVVRATPQAALGVPLARAVTWTSTTPSILSVQPMGAHGDSARIHATGAGPGQVRVNAGNVSRTFQVTVQDTVFTVTVTPGSLLLVAGDTVSYRAAVAGPPNANRSVRWDVTNAALFQNLTSPDPLVFRVQARMAGTATVRATSLADTTKTGSSTATSQVGKLAFVVQPATTSREIPFSRAPTVEVQDAAGLRSARAANTITLSATPGTCAAAATGQVAVDASAGIATFSRAAINARCTSLTLTATASPPAASTVSQAFTVTARGCGAVLPFTIADTLSATMESVDCIVTRGSRQFIAHSYELTVPSSSPGIGIRLHTVSDAFAPRVESMLWQDDPSVAWVDSLTATGTLATAYWLPPGTHRFNVMSASPNGIGAYSRLTPATSETATPGAGWPNCLIVTTPGVSMDVTLTGGACDLPFSSRPGASAGRLFLFYLRAGKSVQVTYRPFGTALDNDAYLESFDATASLTNPPLLGFDDNSGGGVRGHDAMLTVTPVPTGRFILIRAGRVAGAGTSTFTLSISP